MMNPSIVGLPLALLAFIAGGLIGLAFGAVQHIAKQRYENRLQRGKFSTGWLAMPGSFTRVAFLLLALVAIQIAWPILFAGNSQWMVSAGVVLGYGWMLLKEFRKRYITPRSRV